MNNERCELMKKVQASSFALVDLQLFLDTHPYSTEAFEEFKKQSEEYKRLVKEYEMKYGEINPAPSFGQLKYQWLDNPWPWERMSD